MACYNNARGRASADKGKPLEEEKDPLDAAFDDAFSAAAAAPKPTIPAEDVDPLGLDEAFDNAFGPGAASDVEDAAETSVSEVLEDEDSDASEDSRAGLAPSPLGSADVTDEDSDNNAADPGILSRRIRRLRANASFARDGSKVMFTTSLIVLHESLVFNRIATLRHQTGHPTLICKLHMQPGRCDHVSACAVCTSR